MTNLGVLQVMEGVVEPGGCCSPAGSMGVSEVWLTLRKGSQVGMFPELSLAQTGKLSTECLAFAQRGVPGSVLALPWIFLYSGKAGR